MAKQVPYVCSATGASHEWRYIGRPSDRRIAERCEGCGVQRELTRPYWLRQRNRR